jgi:4-diphosphocytidyl-2-C-methyl-D-erythritol kinase
MLREPAPAKVNLFLHVGDKRGDGYHDLTSLAVFPAIGDALFVEPHHNLALAVDGPMVRGLPVDSSNLALNAAHALRHQALAMGRPVGGAAMTLTKNLPVASGIGGGSADAAAALRLLNKLWRLDLPNETLEIIALTLGSDVPVCVASIPRWMEGRGERLSAAPALPQFWLTLVNPGVAVATADVFRTLTERPQALRARTTWRRGWTRPRATIWRRRRCGSRPRSATRWRDCAHRRAAFWPG